MDLGHRQGGRESGHESLRRRLSAQGVVPVWLSAFFDSGADVFISGDLKYHDARNFEFAQKALIDIGHFASEHLIVETFAERLKPSLS